MQTQTIMYAVNTPSGIQTHTLADRPLTCVDKMCGGMARKMPETNAQLFERLAPVRGWHIVRVTAILTDVSRIEFDAPK